MILDEAKDDGSCWQAFLMADVFGPDVFFLLHVWNRTNN